MQTKYSHYITDAEFHMFQKCRWEFDQWATLGGDPRDLADISIDPVSCRQIELMRWERNNFGLQSPVTGLMGILEEFGELAAADNWGERIDAVGDILIFTSNMFCKFRLGLAPMLRYLQEEGFYEQEFLRNSDRRLAAKVEERVGWANHVMLKSQQKIRGYEDKETARRDVCCTVYRLLCRETIKEVADWDLPLEGILESVGDEVLQRDWTKHKEAGVE